LKGEATVMVEWSWRVELKRSIEAGSWSSDARLERALAGLKGRRLLALSTEGRLPELVVTLSAGRWLHAFMTAEGQPSWTVFLTDESWLTVANGVTVHDTQNRRLAARAKGGAT
jgi:hypothetical protein